MSKIEWTDETWNPITGCTKVSAGCANCYAERMAARLVKMGVSQYDGTVNEHGHWTGAVNWAGDDVLVKPLRWRAPRMVFVNSMSDLFHQAVPDEWVERVWEVMAKASQHTFQVLTKRPERMAEWCGKYWPEPLPNVWLGTSVENQAAANERVPWLVDAPAAVRFLSCEPLLGRVDLLTDFTWVVDGNIDWVIVGGESGPGARPMHPDWVRELRNDCTNSGVAFFFKQWGAWIPVRDVRRPRSSVTRLKLDGFPAVTMERVGKAAGGRVLDGREWNDMPRAHEAK